MSKVEKQTTYNLKDLTRLEMRLLDLALAYARDNWPTVFASREDMRDAAIDMHETIVRELGAE